MTWLVPHETAAASAQVLCTPYNHALCLSPLLILSHSLSLRLSLSLSVSLCLSVSLSISVPVCLSVCLPVCLCVCLPVSVSLSVSGRSVCLCLSLSVSLSLHLTCLFSVGLSCFALLPFSIHCQCCREASSSDRIRFLLLSFGIGYWLCHRQYFA